LRISIVSGLNKVGQDYFDHLYVSVIVVERSAGAGDLVAAAYWQDVFGATDCLCPAAGGRKKSTRQISLRRALLVRCSSVVAGLRLGRGDPRSGDRGS